MGNRQFEINLRNICAQGGHLIDEVKTEMIKLLVYSGDYKSMIDELDNSDDSLVLYEFEKHLKTRSTSSNNELKSQLNELADITFDAAAAGYTSRDVIQEHHSQVNQIREEILLRISQQIKDARIITSFENCEPPNPGELQKAIQRVSKDWRANPLKAVDEYTAKFETKDPLLYSVSLTDFVNLNINLNVGRLSTHHLGKEVKTQGHFRLFFKFMATVASDRSGFLNYHFLKSFNGNWSSYELFIRELLIDDQIPEALKLFFESWLSNSIFSKHRIPGKLLSENKMKLYEVAHFIRRGTEFNPENTDQKYAKSQTDTASKWLNRLIQNLNQREVVFHKPGTDWTLSKYWELIQLLDSNGLLPENHLSNGQGSDNPPQ